MNFCKLKWYTLRVNAGKEDKAVKWIIENKKKDKDIDKKISEVALPMKKIFKKKNEVNDIICTPKFPGYIFLKADIEDGSVENFLTKSYKTIYIGFLKNRDGDNNLHICPLREDEVSRILNLEDNNNSEVQNIKDFISGDKVKITDGPFRDFSGIIKDINLKNNSAKVKVSIFSRDMEVEIFLTQLNKL